MKTKKPHLLSIPLPSVQNRETVYQGYYDVHIDHLHLHPDCHLPYIFVDVKADAAAVLARTKDGKLIINNEYRHPTRQWLLSCPGGRIDPNESALQAAERELLEETGYRGNNPQLMGSVYPFPSVSHQLIHYVFVDNAECVQEPNREPFEFIHTELMTAEEVFAEIASGAPVEGVLCTALFLFVTK